MFVSFLPSLDPLLPFRKRQPVPVGQGATFFGKSRQAIAAVLPVLGLKPGDVVLAPASLCWEAVSPLLAFGLRVLCYPLDGKLCPDFTAMKAMADDKTRAVLVVHYYGFAQDIGPIRLWCQDTGLKLIEDCALCFYDGEHNGGVGKCGDAAFFSLWKFLPVPDGSVLLVSGGTQPVAPMAGACGFMLRPVVRLLTARAALFGFFPMRTMKRLHAGGGETVLEPVLPEPKPMSHLSCRIRKRIDLAEIAGLRRRNYTALAALLASERRVALLWPQLGARTVPNAMLVRVGDPGRLQMNLLARGFETELPINRLFRGVDGIEGLPAYPVVDDLADHVLALPVHQDMNIRHIERLAAAVKEALS